MFSRVLIFQFKKENLYGRDKGSDDESDTDDDQDELQ